MRTRTISIVIATMCVAVAIFLNPDSGNSGPTANLYPMQQPTFRLVFPFYAPQNTVDKLLLQQFGVVRYMKWVRFKAGFKWAASTARLYQSSGLSLKGWIDFLDSLKQMSRLAPYIPIEDIRTYQQSLPINQTQQVDRRGKPVVPKPIYYQADARYKLVSISDPDIDRTTAVSIGTYVKYVGRR